MKTVKVDQIEIANNKPFVLIAGLNVLEDEKTIEKVVSSCVKATTELNIPYIFKASYDKANRSSINSFRGPGITRGLEILSEIKKTITFPLFRIYILLMKRSKHQKF